MALSELQVLVDELAERLDAPAVLEDHEQRMVVYSSHDGPVDEVRRDSIMRRETKHEVRDWFRQFGIVKASEPLRIPSHPDLGILGRLCAPVRFRGRLMGWLFLIDDAQRIGPAELALVRHAGEQAGVLLYEEELARRLSTSIMSHLIGPSADMRETAAQQLIEQGLAAAQAPHAVVYLRPVSPVAHELIGEVLWQVRQAGVLRVAGQDHGVLLVRVHREDDDGPARQVAHEARDLLAERLSGRVVAGVGDPRRHLTAAPASYREALLAARVAAAVPSAGDVASWSRLGAYRALVQLPPGERCESCLDPRLLRLLEADVELARTVETYLDLGGDAGRTAGQLKVHRATLYYRLNKAQQLTGANLRDGGDRLALHLSFKLARLIERY